MQGQELTDTEINLMWSRALRGIQGATEDIPLWLAIDALVATLTSAIAMGETEQARAEMLSDVLRMMPLGVHVAVHGGFDGSTCPDCGGTLPIEEVE